MLPLLGVVDFALAVLSVRSIVVLTAASAWTRAGWAGTLGYCIAAALEYGGAPMRALWTVGSYVCIVELTAAFVIAGVRDEAQAEPWWWPAQPGPTREQRRR